MEKTAYLICYSTDEGPYTSHVVFLTKNLAEEKCIELIEEDGLDWYVTEVPLIY